MAANLALAEFLGWNWSLWPVPTWLAVQQSKAVFLITLYDIMNNMKYLQTFSITPQPCHSHFCYQLLPIWPKLDSWAENAANGLCRLGWRYNGAKLYFSWTHMLVSMIWNSAELSALHLSRDTAIFVVDCCQFGLSWIFGLKMELMAYAGLIGGFTEQICISLT